MGISESTDDRRGKENSQIPARRNHFILKVPSFGYAADFWLMETFPTLFRLSAKLCDEMASIPENETSPPMIRAENIFDSSHDLAM